MLRRLLLCLAQVASGEPAVPRGEAAVGSEGAGFHQIELRPEPGRKPGLTLTDPQLTGVCFTNLLQGDAYLTNAVAHNGSGVAIGDVDGDGWQDLYFCSLQGPNRLYRNLGQWRFEERETAAACPEQYSTGATFADVDGNGTLDLLVNGIEAGTRLFINDGRGNLAERTESGLSRTASSTSPALADIDGDGDLDLYCTHYIDIMHLADPTTRFALGKRGSQWVVTKVNDQPTTLPKWKDRFEALPDGSVRELPEYHGFYRNNGQGQFVPILFEPGVFMDEEARPIPPTRDWGLSVMFRDLNDDGAPDFYVCNDNASPDRFWMNTGNGTFRALARSKLRHTSRSSMGLDFADVNRDGHDDLLVLDMLAREHAKRLTQLVRDRPKVSETERGDTQPRFNRNMLFLGRPDGSFVETALMAGVAATGWSWCPMFLDVDLDGFEDLLVTTGFGMDVMDQDSHDQMRQQMRQMTPEQRKRARRMHPAWPTRSLVFRNRRDGTFELANDWGFDREGIANGAALGDLDHDGDLDVVVNNLNEVASVYRNESPAPRVAIRLKGRPPNTQGIGARIALVGRSLTQSQEMICGGRYLSGDQAMRVFAVLPEAEGPMRLEVRWRDGARSLIRDVEANRLYEIEQPALPGSAPVAAPSKPQPLFDDVSPLIGHVHEDQLIDDRARQPMLPRRLNTLGPGVAWYDLNGDGWEDLVVTAGRGGRLGAYLNEQGRAFRLIEGLPEVATAQGAAVGWPDGRGGRFLVMTVSSDMQPAAAESALLVASATDLTSAEVWPAGKASFGPLALADVDGDSDLDLFVGGRWTPGHYPEPVDSAIWLNREGRLVPDETTSQPLRALGLVSGATFADLDDDGDADLALAIEWGPVRILRNESGRFQDVTSAWGLASFTGWWTSVTAGDFDGDGRVDLACGNAGRNTIYELLQPTALRLYYGDWNGDNYVELIEAWQCQGAWLPARDRTWLAQGLPELVNRFPSHQVFARATLADILPPGQVVPHLEAAQLGSAVFLNRGGRFEPAWLPAEAQWAPVFAMNAGDFDGDGVEDLFLGQNFFGADSDLSRDDNGRGLCLRGTGQGRFTAMDTVASGIEVSGEQRGAAMADFNHDGRTDLAVTQRGAATRLFLNQGAKVGLRVVLQGPSLNPDGVGVRLRVLYAGGRRGPCRVVQLGSGYWSQDASVQVLGLQDEPVALWVRWPGGREETLPLKASDRTLVVTWKP